MKIKKVIPIGGEIWGNGKYEKEELFMIHFEKDKKNIKMLRFKTNEWVKVQGDYLVETMFKTSASNKMSKIWEVAGYFGLRGYGDDASLTVSVDRIVGEYSKEQERKRPKIEFTYLIRLIWGKMIRTEKAIIQ